MPTRFCATFGLFLACLLLVAGCDSKKKEPVPKPDKGDNAGVHVHGPNEGELYELGGDDYHAELLQDVDHKIVTIFVLDKNQNPLPIAEEAVVIRMTSDGAPVEFALAAKPLEGETGGMASRFESKDEALVLALANETADREMEVKIEGKPYIATFEYYEPHHHAHGDHEHGDEHGDHENGDHEHGEHDDHKADDKSAKAEEGHEHEEGHDDEHKEPATTDAKN